MIGPIRRLTGGSRHERVGIQNGHSRRFWERSAEMVDPMTPVLTESDLFQAKIKKPNAFRHGGQLAGGGLQFDAGRRVVEVGPLHSRLCRSRAVDAGGQPDRDQHSGNAGVFQPEQVFSSG